jgi:hypothetical protein
MSSTILVRDQLYLYGLVDRSNTLDEEALGHGVAAARVRMVGDGPLVALVSDIAPGQVAQTRRNMLSHTAVLERAMASTTILPMRFGTVVPDITTLVACIARNVGPFAAALQSIDGRVELGVKASWRDKVIYTEIIESDPSLFRLRNRLRDRPGNETYYERVELGRRIEAALTDRRRSEADAIAAELSPLSDREIELRMLDDDMILNRAFLVPRRHEATFDATMQRLAERLASRVVFRYIGPVPPYNFIQLRADWLERGA